MTDNSNGRFHTEQVTFETEETVEPGKQTTKRKKLTIDTEDIIAGGAVFVAVVTILAIVAGFIELNKYSVGLAGFSGAGAVIAKIIGARKKGATEPDKPEKE